jgi:hypothetical protein
VFWRPTPAITATVIMTVFGISLWLKKETRLSVGFLTTANLLIPVTLLLSLGQWNILPANSCQWGTETIYNVLEKADSYVLLGNIQIYLSAWCWLVFSLLFLRITRSSIFVIFSIIAFLTWLTSCYIIAGLEEWIATPDKVGGRYLLPGIGLFVLGAFFDRKKFVHYASPLCITGLILIVLSLSVICISENTIFGWIWAKPDFLSQNEQIALSFGICGMIYLGLATLCNMMGTILQRNLALILNWLGSFHILGSLRILDSILASNDHEIVYRILLPIASFAFVFVSVPKQMKSFFFAGLGGIAFSVHRFTIEHLDEFFAWPIALIVTGIVWMFISWLVPRYKAVYALKHKKIAEKTSISTL